MIYFLCCLLGSAVTAVISIWFWSKELKLLDEQLAELAETEKQLPKVTDPPLVFQTEERNIVPIWAEMHILVRRCSESPTTAAKYATGELAWHLGKQILQYAEIRLEGNPGDAVETVRAEVNVIAPSQPGSVETAITEKYLFSKMKG